MSESDRGDWLDPELERELRETAETLGRLGQTLGALSLSMLSPRQRNRVERLSTEVRRAGQLLPRTVGVLIEKRVEPLGPERREREDLGSRLRRLEGSGGTPDDA